MTMKDNIPAFDMGVTPSNVISQSVPSILEVDALGKRASIVDFWIRVADVCGFLSSFLNSEAKSREEMPCSK